MQSKPVIIALSLILVPLISSAEFYKYRDESGVLHYTDDLSKIPEDQLPKVDTYEERDDFILPELKQPKIEDEKRQKLSKAKAAVDKEYKELTQTKQSLVDAQAETMQRAENAKANSEKMFQLNKRIADYEKRRQKIRNRKEYIELKKEYKELMDTKQALENARAETKKNAAVVKGHSKKVRQLNKRITDYEQRRQTVRQEIDAFNASKHDSINTD